MVKGVKRILPRKWGYPVKVAAATFTKGWDLRSKFYLGVSGVSLCSRLMHPLRLKIIKQQILSPQLLTTDSMKKCHVSALAPGALPSNAHTCPEVFSTNLCLCFPNHSTPRSSSQPTCPRYFLFSIFQNVISRGFSKFCSRWAQHFCSLFFLFLYLHI